MYGAFDLHSTSASRRRTVARWTALLSFTITLSASADADRVQTTGSSNGDTHGPPHTWFNLRVGASSGNRTARPEVCGEVSPLAWFSLQACGTGAGLWHDDPQPQLAHFRADVRLTSYRMGDLWLMPRVGAGMAEMQIGQDDAGFQFTSTGQRGVETAGPEAAASLRLACALGQGFEGLGDIYFGAAWLPHAPGLVMPQSAFQPFLGLSVGAGF